MYSAKNVFPVPLSPWRMIGLDAGAKACARDTATIIGGAKAIGSFNPPRRRSPDARPGVVTRCPSPIAPEITSDATCAAERARSMSSVFLVLSVHRSTFVIVAQEGAVQEYPRACERSPARRVMFPNPLMHVSQPIWSHVNVTSSMRELVTRL